MGETNRWGEFGIPEGSGNLDDVSFLTHRLHVTRRFLRLFCLAVTVGSKCPDTTLWLRRLERLKATVRRLVSTHYSLVFLRRRDKTLKPTPGSTKLRRHDANTLTRLRSR